MHRLRRQVGAPLWFSSARWNPRNHRYSNFQLTLEIACCCKQDFLCMRREIFVPSHRSSQLHKHANIQNNMNILRIFRLLCRLNKLTFPLCESTETVFTHRENPVYKSSQFPNQGESCYKHSSGSVLVYQLSLCALADQLLFNPRTVLKITW